MISSVTLALVYSIGAGVINGSFALPTKHIKTWNFENIWFIYAIWAFLLLPWLTVYFLDSRIGSIYASMSQNTWLILLGGGFLFGTGQVCFALALRNIGLGLAFVINIGLAAGLGSLLPLFSLGYEKIGTPSGILSITGVICILIALLFSYSAGQQRDYVLQSKDSLKKNIYRFDIGLVILAGLFSAGQNITFSLTHGMQQIALERGMDSLVSSILIWPPFLTCSLIPYTMYMLYLHAKNNSFTRYFKSHFLRNSLLGITMAGFWFGSLAIYSKASLLIGTLGPVIVWPLFMVLIIMTSHVLSWHHGEWDGCPRQIKNRANLAVFLLILAVIILAYSAKMA